MKLLPVAAAFDGFHKQILRCNERQIFSHGLVHDLLVHPQSPAYILQQAQDSVRAEKALRQGQTAVGRVVQRALKPLGCSGKWGV